MDSLSSPTKARASMGPGGQSSVLSAAARKNAPPVADFDFNLGAAKAKVAKAFDDKIPPQFRKYYAGQQYDRLLQTVLLYFTAMFQLDWVVKAMERARKQHLEGYNPYVVAQRIHELDEEMSALRMELSPQYSALILKYSSYSKPQQDRMFFEALYSSLISMCDEAFGRLGKRPDIEKEIGALFRSKHFNMYHRQNQPPRSVDTLSCKELYAIKHETTNRALNARMLASLFEKPPTLGVTVASVTNSPLISQYIMSPIVARSMMKDPEQRQKMFNTAASAASPTDSPRRNMATVFKSAAMLQGVDPVTLASELGNMKMKGDTAAEIGLMSAERSRRGESRQPGIVAVAPEAAGLPVDESLTYLLLFKRYINYGPAMGLQPGATGLPPIGGVGGGSVGDAGSSTRGTVPPTPSAGGGGALSGVLASMRGLQASAGGQ